MKIGIVGSGGAGMAAAWMLDQEHDVTVFERNEVIGGHAHTVEVESGGHVHYIDSAFNWFNSTIYPTFSRYIDHLGIERVKVPLRMSFTDTRRGASMNLPPRGLFQVGRLLRSPRDIATLLQFFGATLKANRIVREHRTEISCREFIADLKGSERFKREFLIPVLSGIWGGPIERTEDFSIYPLLKYVVLNDPIRNSDTTWYVAKGGSNAYIRAVAGTLSERARVLTSTQIQSISRTEDQKLQVVYGDETDPDIFDHVVIAAGAPDAAKILEGNDEFAAVRGTLERFEYYTARVIAHSDLRLMPPDRRHWEGVNVMYNGRLSDVTIWDGWWSGEDVFDSVYYDDELPNNIHNISKFRVPLETPDFFANQPRLAAHQGDGNLWFAGDYSHDIGSHEDAIVSAVRVVRGIDSGGARFKLLSS